MYQSVSATVVAGVRESTTTFDGEFQPSLPPWVPTINTTTNTTTTTDSFRTCPRHRSVHHLPNDKWVALQGGAYEWCRRRHKHCFLPHFWHSSAVLASTATDHRTISAIATVMAAICSIAAYKTCYAFDVYYTVMLPLPAMPSFPPTAPPAANQNLNFAFDPLHHSGLEPCFRAGLHHVLYINYVKKFF
jgi:hypothetical protein